MWDFFCGRYLTFEIAMDEKTASGESEEATGTGRPTNSKVLSAGGNVFCIQPSFDPRKIEACIEAKVLTK